MTCTFLTDKQRYPFSSSCMTQEINVISNNILAAVVEKTLADVLSTVVVVVVVVVVVEKALY